MNYLTKFDSDGYRLESYPIDRDITEERYAEMLDDGYIEIDEEDWNYYVGNKGTGNNGTGYVYDNETGRPVSAPPYQPSVDSQLESLDAQYESDKQDLLRQYIDALLHSDSETMANIQTEMKALDEKYDSDYAEIAGEE